jgi:hypothetical protein
MSETGWVPIRRPWARTIRKSVFDKRLSKKNESFGNPEQQSLIVPAYLWLAWSWQQPWQPETDKSRYLFIEKSRGTINPLKGMYHGFFDSKNNDS